MSDKFKEFLGFLGCIAVLVGGIYGVNWLFKDDSSTTNTSTQTQTPSGSDSLYFSNCTEARDAGYENIAQGDPGYRPELDRDGDGLACEPYTP